jgi:hypothetical protein
VRHLCRFLLTALLYVGLVLFFRLRRSSLRLILAARKGGSSKPTLAGEITSARNGRADGGRGGDGLHWLAFNQPRVRPVKPSAREEDAEMPHAHRLRHRRPAATEIEAAPFRAHSHVPEPAPTSFRCAVNNHRACSGVARVQAESYHQRVAVLCGCDCHRT